MLLQHHYTAVVIPTATRSVSTTGTDKSLASPLTVHAIRRPEDFPSGVSRADLVSFLVEHLGTFGDPDYHIDAAIDYAFSESDGKGGFLLAAIEDDHLVGAMVVNDTGMSGFIPEHILVYVAVDGAVRGRGIGTNLMQALEESCDGDIALHVEYDNPARRLYERLGFTSKYAEMRLQRSR